MKEKLQHCLLKIRCTPLVTLPFALCFVCSGQNIIAPLASSSPRPHAIQLQSLEWVVPELIIGGEWTSSIKLTNRGTQAIPTTNVAFWDNTGNPLQTTFQGTSGSTFTGPGFSFSLGVGGIVEAIFLGGTSAAFGMATIACSALGCGTHGLYAEVTLRNHNSTRPDFVVVFPIEKPVPLQYMLFDGRETSAGYVTTTLYLVNQNVTASVVAIDVCDVNNNILVTVPLTFTAGGTQILTLHAIAPQTIGIEGTLVFRGLNTTDPNTLGIALITATALRIDPSNSFAPVRAFVPGP